MAKLEKSVIAYIGLGANLGEAPQTLHQACDALDQLPDSCVQYMSSIYRSAPLGYTEQADFYNAVVALETSLLPLQLLQSVLSIEQSFGRTRSFLDAPRTLDLDILLYGDQVVVTPGLQIPHPRMQQRAFVLHPLCEIDPSCIIPGLGVASQFLAQVSAQRVEKLSRA